jgi:hypothetical protein
METKKKKLVVKAVNPLIKQIEEKQKKGEMLSKAEKLFLEGKKFYNFALDVKTMDEFFGIAEPLGIKASDFIIDCVKKYIEESK